MTPVRIGSAIKIALALWTFTANAAQFGTSDEAVAMVKRVKEKFKRMVLKRRSRQLRLSSGFQGPQPLRLHHES
jgi:hypothetical protein